MLEEETISNNAPSSEAGPFFSKWSPPQYLWRGLLVFVLAGQVIIKIINGKVHWRNTLQQLERVGPMSIGACLLTSAFVGMAFTIQFVGEFTRLSLHRSVGGVLALAFSRELITPRVITSYIALPFLTLMCFTMEMASSALLADDVYGVSINIIMDSAQKALKSWDIISLMFKSHVFGAIISIVSCAWGVTTIGGANGVGESTTSAVVLSLVDIFIADFALSYCLFQGPGDSLKNCM